MSMVRTICAPSGAVAEDMLLPRADGTCETDAGTLRALVEELRAEIALKDEFVSLISHELKSPLALIQGTAEYLRDREYDPETLVELVGSIHRAALHTVRVLDGLLLIARGEHAVGEDFEPLLVGPTITSICGEFRTEAGTLVDIRPMGQDGIVVGSRTYIEQIVVNLLTNAAKYGGGADPIEVQVRVDRDVVQVCVSDRGAGVDEHEAERIFDPFVRGRRTSSTRTGLGIGLAVSKRLARVMQGDILFESRQGGGTTFILQLPRVEALPD